jgi:hypothetical protein
LRAVVVHVAAEQGSLGVRNRGRNVHDAQLSAHLPTLL